MFAFAVSRTVHCKSNLKFNYSAMVSTLYMDTEYFPEQVPIALTSS